nr:Ger(x)C family spore germination C-terminal domain-containing protein [Bacillus subtilis]
MQNNVSFAVPKVSVDQGKLILDGASIIKNRRFLTNISPLAVQSYNLLTGDGKGGVIEFKYDHSIYSFEIFKMKHHIKTHKSASGRYQFDVSVTLDGRLSEDWNERENAFNEKYLREIEGVVKRRLESDVKDFIKELQHEITEWFYHRYVWLPLRTILYIQLHKRFPLMLLDMASRSLP